MAPRGVDPYLEQLAHRGPEAGWHARVLHRERQGQWRGFVGGVPQVGARPAMVFRSGPGGNGDCVR
jgi:hypothetical protein